MIQISFPRSAMKRCIRVLVSCVDVGTTRHNLCDDVAFDVFCLARKHEWSFTLVVGDARIWSACKEAIQDVVKTGLACQHEWCVAICIRFVDAHISVEQDVCTFTVFRVDRKGKGLWRNPKFETQLIVVGFLPASGFQTCHGR